MSAKPTDGRAHKEWLHFVIQTGASHVLVNFSIMEATLGGRTWNEPRLALMCNTGRAWHGSVRNLEAGQVRAVPGDLDLDFDRNRLCFRDGVFVIQVEQDGIALDARIRPLMLPTVTSSVSFGPGHGMHWVVVPRLLATGRLVVEGKSHELHDAPTYHDHNWGQFRWGHDLSWEWGFVAPPAPDDPWSVVFVRVSDGARTRTLSQGVLVWREDVNVRTFQNREITFTTEGVHRQPQVMTVPLAGALLVPGAASGVPARLAVEAQGPQAGANANANANDRLHLTYAPTSVGRIVIPSDVDDFGVTLLNESVGLVSVEGRIRGHKLALEAPSIVEFVRGA